MALILAKILNPAWTGQTKNIRYKYQAYSATDDEYWVMKVTHGTT